jgi:riboflavin synthase
VFTGIVEELGAVVAFDAGRLSVKGSLVTSDAKPGDSIAVNGVCLTVVDVADGEFTADVMAETLRRSALGALRPGDPVNLERAARLGDRIGGHLVQGHVDGVGTVLDRHPDTTSEVVRIGLPPGLARYVVSKGSIAVDGVSLTVLEVTDSAFAVSLIPTTLALTTLRHAARGDRVNVEVDVVAKYVEKLVAAAERRRAGEA